MSRKVAVIWHASFWIAAGVLYFLFVLPRWWELAGVTTHTLGTVLRIVAGALIGLAALPVVFTLLRTRRPELGTPQLALTLRTWSIALHVLAGVLIVGTAISEIWLSLDSAGRWLFGIYGAGAAVALLGIFAYYLAFVAELPPPPPKPLKPKTEKQRRGRRKAAEGAGDDTAEEAVTDEESTSEDGGERANEPAESGEQPDSERADVTAENSDDEAAAEPSESEKYAAEDLTAAEEIDGGLRNHRSSGKISLRKRKRSRGGVAVDD